MKAPAQHQDPDALFAEAMQQAPWSERATWVNTRRHDLTRLVDALGADMHRLIAGLGEVQSIEQTARQLQARVDHVTHLCQVLSQVPLSGGEQSDDTSLGANFGAS